MTKSSTCLYLCLCLCLCLCLSVSVSFSVSVSLSLSKHKNRRLTTVTPDKMGFFYLTFPKILYAGVAATLPEGPVRGGNLGFDLVLGYLERMTEKELDFKPAVDVEGKGNETAGAQGGVGGAKGKEKEGGGRVKMEWIEGTRRKSANITVCVCCFVL